jgi:hypothetical protein
MSLTSNHLASPAAVGLNPNRDFFILSCETAIQLAYGTSSILLRCPFVPEIMHGRAPEVFLEHGHMTFTVSVWPKPKRIKFDKFDEL